MYLIRKAAEDDLPQLMALNIEVHEYHRQARPDIFKDPTPEAVRRHLVSYLATDQVATFVAEEGSQLLGYVQVEVKVIPEGDFNKQVRHGIINNLAVTASMRRNGVGRKLLQKAEEWLRQKDLDYSQLNVWEFNESAIRFYEKIGYSNYSRKMARSLN
jgi:ribosomal protein S18 acetylase RimI-like enzyme